MMPHQTLRSRSTTSASNPSSNRPISRASTTSYHSSNTQISPQDTEFQFPPVLSAAQAQALRDHNQSAPPQYAQQYIPASLSNYDPALEYANHPEQHYGRLHQLDGAVGEARDRPTLSRANSFAVEGEQGLVIHAPSGAETEKREKKAPSSSATNDKELREMLQKNNGRSLKSVAQEVIAAERTPRAEKTKQLFAMLWLKAVCRKDKASVPRQRVYSYYATRCGTERVIPLNPASFGKLVRVIFPGIQTRRLGIRGESKYHYVDLALDDSEHALNHGEGGQTGVQPDVQSHHLSSFAAPIDFNSIPRLPAETASFPPQEHATFEAGKQSHHTGIPSKGILFSDPNVPGLDSGNYNPDTYDLRLQFAVVEASPFREEPIALPDINPFITLKTDPDVAHALTALYRTHCTSLIDCIRFCKEKQFFRLFTSFQGTLTVPVQKLLAHPDLAPWIRACDLLMYQKMVRVVSSLALQVVPPAILDTLNNISATLGLHIRKTFQGQPDHVMEAKLGPAVVFASLLYRLVRANRSAHAAANFLCDDDTRTQMWHDWVRIVNPKRIIEAELPKCGYAGYAQVYDILTRDVRLLLDPPNIPLWFENGTFYEACSSSPQNQQALQHDGDGSTTKSVLERWCSLLTELPRRFPKVDTRTLLQCINTISTAAIRELTITSASSFGAWWCIKVWLDEMSQWLTAMGGFLNQQPSDGHQSPVPADMNGYPIALGNPFDGLGGIHEYAHDGSGQADRREFARFNGGGMPSLRRSNTAPNPGNFSLDFSDNPPYQHSHDPNDDSGIGMGLLDEDLTLAKSGLSPANPPADINGADTAVVQ